MSCCPASHRTGLMWRPGVSNRRKWNNLPRVGEPFCPTSQSRAQDPSRHWVTLLSKVRGVCKHLSRIKGSANPFLGPSLTSLWKGWDHNLKTGWPNFERTTSVHEDGRIKGRWGGCQYSPLSLACGSDFGSVAATRSSST